MNILKNEKYKKMEKQAIFGDPLRNSPAVVFPWLLEEESFEDEQGDLWIVKIYCDALWKEPLGHLFVVQLRSQEICQLGSQTIGSMDLDPHRLASFLKSDWNQVEENNRQEYLTDFESIQKKSKIFLSFLKNRIKKEKNIDFKKEKIYLKIKNSKFSKFST